MTKIFVHTREIEAFLKEARSFEILSAEEENRLFIEYRQTHDEKIRARIINGQQLFVYSVAREFCTGKDDVMSYVNDGNIGLLTAFDKFDPSLGFKFNTYAVHYIRQAMGYARATVNQEVRRSNGLKLGAAPERIRERYFAEHGSWPSDEEVKEILLREKNIDVKDDRDLRTLNMMSINSTISSGDDDMTYEDNPEFAAATCSENAYEKEVEAEENSLLCSKLLSVLSERDREIVKKSFGIGCSEMTADDLAEEFNLTAVRIRQILVKATEKMQAAARQIRR